MAKWRHCAQGAASLSAAEGDLPPSCIRGIVPLGDQGGPAQTQLISGAAGRAKVPPLGLL